MTETATEIDQMTEIMVNEAMKEIINTMDNQYLVP